MSSLITRKIDMMGLIYGQSASQSSGINKDFFAVEELCDVYHCSLLQRLKPMMDTRPPSMPGIGV